MKHLLTTAFGMFILFFVASCGDDDEINPALAAFIGNYEVESIHTTGLHAVYDSVGNVIDYTTETVVVATPNFEIASSASIDSVRITGLLGAGNDVGMGTLSGDSLIIHFEQGDNIRNDYIRGTLWLNQADSLLLRYRWDHSDIWSPQAIPEYGEVVGNGVRR